VRSQPKAQAYHVSLQGGVVVEAALEMVAL